MPPYLFIWLSVGKAGNQHCRPLCSFVIDECHALLNDFFSKWPEVASITGHSALVMTFHLLFSAQKECQKTDVHKQLTIHIFATSIFFLRKRGAFVCRQQPALYPQANEELNAMIMLRKIRDCKTEREMWGNFHFKFLKDINGQVKCIKAEGDFPSRR